MREMTGKERAQLEEMVIASRRPGWGEHFWLLVAAATVLPTLYSAILLVPLAIGARLIGFPIGNGAWKANPITYYGAILVVAGIWLAMVALQIRWSIRAEGSRSHGLAKLKEDLARGLVRDEVLTVTGAKLLREPEHDMIVFFLQLSNGKCFVLYDYDSVDINGEFDGQSRPTLTPREIFHLVTFPASKRRGWSFSGPEIALPDVLPMAATPDLWPEDESWCRVKWENIERHYGPKKNR
ncbi:hypothetical protein [Tabrizicola sp.]|uniref:hypothetical protein n=1 Tax=Tabrizicola sp. TaxID=2005166 RepID=UPI003F35EEA5